MTDMMMFLVTLVTLSSASAQPGDDYSVADIDCSQPGPLPSSPVLLSARLTKPRGYGGVPVFADRSVSCQIRGAISSFKAVRLFV